MNQIQNKLKQKEIQLFNAKMHSLTMQETLVIITEAIKARQAMTHCVVNVAKIVNMQKDEQLKQSVNECDLINIDGMGVVWGGKFLGFSIPERVAGIDLMLALLKEAEKNNLRPFFLGAKQEVLEQTIQKIKKTFPNLQIAGWHNGYFQTNEEDAVVQQINASQADILFVAMSSPKKENFIKKYHQAMNVPFVMGVGGSFDVIAEYVKRAPAWMQTVGLEWLYRLCQEPRRMWKRYLITNSIFAAMLLKAKWKCILKADS